MALWIDFFTIFLLSFYKCNLRIIFYPIIYIIFQYKLQRFMSYRCVLHPDTPITHYCQTCTDLVCQNCINKQPHSGSNHTIKQIKDSANVRKNIFASFIEKQINPLRSQSLKRIQMFEMIKKQTERDRKVIQKDIKIEFEAIHHRLLDKKTQMQIKKQTQIKHIQNYVHALDDINSAFDSLYQNPQAMLIGYKTLQAEIKRLQSLKHNIIQELPQSKQLSHSRQYLTTLHKSQTLPQYEDRNQFVNKLITEYIKYYEKKLKQTKSNCQKQGKLFQHTFNNTFKLITSDQVAKVCAFCGCPFTIDNVNQQCANNRTYKMNCIYPDVKWQTIIPESIRGKKMHYWYQSKSMHRKKPKMEQHSLVRKTTKKHYYNSLKQLQMVKYVLKQYQIQKGKTFSDLVETNDAQKSGYITKVAFIYTMNKIYNLPNEQIQSLINLLQDDKGINYSRLDQVLQNPTEDYYKFVAYQQEQNEKNKPVGPTSGGWKRYPY